MLATMAGRVDVKEDGYDPLESRETIETAFDSLKRDPKDPSARLKYKIEILKDLKKEGIALVDVSPFAIYFGSKTVKRRNKKTGREYWTPGYKLKDEDYKNIISTAFKTYSGPLILDIKPESVLVLGKLVGKVLCANGMLQEKVNSFGGNLLDTMTHPSSVASFWGENAASNLQTLRHHSLVARGMIHASTPVPMQIVSSKKPVATKKASSAKRGKKARRKNKRSSPKTGTRK